ncbi:hypothetical protein RIR_jg32283.t1 [Rhizophagus irregularis DAOM 181602=DAOM 197198]|nr:hypothetical protein RIR_jg32283.t1 [Rhizophagus irregularis DAOM 181602=DAOM 197198]
MTSQPQIPSSQGLLLVLIKTIGYIPKNWTVILSNETQKLQIHPTLMASEEVFLSDSGIFLEFGSCRPSITDYREYCSDPEMFATAFSSKILNVYPHIGTESDECIVLPSTLKAATPVGATTILFSLPMAIILKGAMDSTLSPFCLFNFRPVTSSQFEVHTLPVACRRLLHQNRYLQLLEYHPIKSLGSSLIYKMLVI